MKRLSVAVCTLALLMVPSLSAPALAVSSCSWNAATATVAVTVEDASTATLAISGGVITLDTAACDAAATTAAVDTIAVTGGAGASRLVIDLTGGAFAPGASSETGTAEIEFTGNLAGGFDILEVIGTSGVDTLAFGSAGGNLNDDDDADEAIAGIDEVWVVGQGGADQLSADGDTVVGSPLTVEVSIDGGLDADTIAGGSASDALDGGDGADTIDGGGGNDVLRGAAGSDLLEGQSDRDRIVPGPGTDRADGGVAKDTIDLSSANAAVVIHVGRGHRGGETTGEGNDRIFRFERARGSRFADLIFGTRRANVLDGWRGRDRIAGSDGDDTLLGGPGQDLLKGGAGADQVVGGAGHDSLSGGAVDDHLAGGGGSDLLHGDGGNDALNGGAGTDTCFQDSGSGPESSCEKPASG